MTRHIKLKDGTELQETQKGVFSLIFPNKRYMIFTTWTGKVKVSTPKMADFELGEVQIV